jgi:hypothetical protein
MCDHVKRVLDRLQHRDDKLNSNIIELKKKLEIEASKNENQVKPKKAHSLLLTFSWFFFVVFVSVFGGKYYGACNGNFAYKHLP